MSLIQHSQAASCLWQSATKVGLHRRIVICGNFLLACIHHRLKCWAIVELGVLQVWYYRTETPDYHRSENMKLHPQVLIPRRRREGLICNSIAGHFSFHTGNQPRPDDCIARIVRALNENRVHSLEVLSWFSLGELRCPLRRWSLAATERFTIADLSREQHTRF